ncbi:hypothetical protein DFAR_3990027 [Desulfarculales bacterium]
MDMSLSEKLQAVEFAVLAELEPSKGVDVASFVANAQRASKAWWWCLKWPTR